MGTLKAATRLYPFVVGETADAKPILIDPAILGSPGRRRRVRLDGAIVERLDAGESVEDVATDYELSVDAITKAVLFEGAV